MAKSIGFYYNYYSFVFTVSFLLFIRAAICWTEKDEAKRIAQIKSEEQKLYEEQMGEKLPPLSSGSTSAEGIVTAAAADEFLHAAPLLSAPHHSQGTSHHSLRHLLPSASAASLFNNSILPPFWCFHCASPWNAISEPMQRVVKNLLEIRRAQYPTADIVRRDCAAPKHLDHLPRQFCNGYSHCQTLILTDHGTGSAFTMRGCAERFGAVDAQVLARRGDNTCKRLHDKVDIQECICEHRKYCHSGTERMFSLKFSPMSEWHRQRMIASGQHPKIVVPSAEALQRHRNGAAGRGDMRGRTIGLMFGMAMAMVVVGTSINEQLQRRSFLSTFLFIAYSK